MARTTNGNEAERKWKAKFPDKELLTFSGVVQPVKIRCPIHGIVEYGSFRAALASKHGCPECAKEHQVQVAAAALAESREKRKTVIESNLQALGEFALWSSKEPLPTDDYVYVPFLKDVEFAAGTGSFTDEDYNGYRLPFAKSTLRRHGINPEDAICFSVRGDSMEPRFFDGSHIGVDRGRTTIKNGDVYALIHEGMLRVKVLHKSGDSVRLVSYNDAYPDESVPLREIQVVGRVFWSSDLF